MKRMDLLRAIAMPEDITLKIQTLLEVRPV